MTLMEFVIARHPDPRTMLPPAIMCLTAAQSHCCHQAGLSAESSMSMAFENLLPFRAKACLSGQRHHAFEITRSSICQRTFRSDHQRVASAATKRPRAQLRTGINVLSVAARLCLHPMKLHRLF